MIGVERDGSIAVKQLPPFRKKPSTLLKAKMIALATAADLSSPRSGRQSPRPGEDALSGKGRTKDVRRDETVACLP
jgi:hypothetical protein